MNQQSTFHENSIEDTASPVESGGLLEEMNLPPQVISFIRTNLKQIQIAAACLAVAVFVWIIVDGYLEKKADKAAYALYTAMEASDNTARLQALESVKSSFSGKASFWSLIEIAHLDFANGNYDDALQKYQKALSDLPSGSSLRSLIILSIALIVEQQGDLNGAADYYQSVADMGGFELQVYPALGRIHAALGNDDKAKYAYEQYLLTAQAEGATPMETALIEGKIAVFQPSTE